MPALDGGIADFQCSSCDVRQLASAFTGLALVEAAPAWVPSPTEESRGLVKTAGERTDLYELLQPADPLDVPVPGFPSHAALVARGEDRTLNESGRRPSTLSA